MTTYRDMKRAAKSDMLLMLATEVENFWNDDLADNDRYQEAWEEAQTEVRDELRRRADRLMDIASYDGGPHEAD